MLMIAMISTFVAAGTSPDLVEESFENGAIVLEDVVTEELEEVALEDAAIEDGQECESEVAALEE